MNNMDREISIEEGRTSSNTGFPVPLLPSLHPNSFTKRSRAKAHELRKPAGRYLKISSSLNIYN